MAKALPKLPDELLQRKSPHQDRSRDSVARILQASAELLVEDGVDKLTTRRIAAKAKVNVATLYQFFPNKQSIVFTLYEDWIEASKAVFQRADETLNGNTDWQTFFSNFLGELENVGFDEKLESRLTQAVGVYEDIHKIDMEYLRWAVKKVVGYIHHFAPDCPKDTTRALASTLLEWDMALVNLEVNNTKAVYKEILKMSRESRMHLLAVHIDGKS